MGWDRSDAAQAQYDADLAHEALEAAIEEAEQIADQFTQEHAAEELHPVVTVDLSVSSDDQPLFVFSMEFALDDDLASESYPLDEIEQLTSALRSKIRASDVDNWEWLVTVATRAHIATGDQT